MTQLLTPRQVAERLSVSPRTVYAWIAEGRLPHVRLSERVTRVPEDAVDALVADGLKPAMKGLLAAEERAIYAGGVATAPIRVDRTAPGALFCMRCGGEIDPWDTRTPTERLRALLADKRGDILRLAARNRATNIRVFGSVARGDARPGSDIDILVDLEEGASSLDLGGLEFDLQDLLGVKVDVVVAAELKTRSKDRVLFEAVPL